MKVKILTVSLVCLACFAAGYYMAPNPIEEETKTVELVKEQERVTKRIVEHPDGTKETTIVEERQKQAEREAVAVRYDPAFKRDWLVSVSAGLHSDLRGPPIYSLGVSNRVILGLFAGVYARTDGEFGLSLTYSF